MRWFMASLPIKRIVSGPIAHEIPVEIILRPAVWALAALSLGTFTLRDVYIVVLAAVIANEGHFICATHLYLHRYISTAIPKAAIRLMMCLRGRVMACPLCNPLTGTIPAYVLLFDGS